MTDQAVYDFSNLYQKHKLWKRMTWNSIPCQKTPNDMWMYSEMLFELRPELVIELGTHLGGTALFFADILKIIGHEKSQVVTIDKIEQENRPEHPKLTYLHGNVNGEDILEKVNTLAGNCEGHVFVVEDSEHSAQSIERVISNYSPLVTVGSYLVIEDLGVNFPLVDRFLEENENWQRQEPKYLFSLAEKGILNRCL